MKKEIACIALSLITSFAWAQKINESEVPDEIKNTFKKEFPKIKEGKWEKEKSNYEVSFDLDKVNNSLLIDLKGNIIERETEIKLTELPIGAIEYVKKNYAGKEIKEAAKITNAKGVIIYEAEIKGLDLLFDSFGTFLKEVKD